MPGTLVIVLTIFARDVQQTLKSVGHWKEFVRPVPYQHLSLAMPLNLVQVKSWDQEFANLLVLGSTGIIYISFIHLCSGLRVLFQVQEIGVDTKELQIWSKGLGAASKNTLNWVILLNLAILVSAYNIAKFNACYYDLLFFHFGSVAICYRWYLGCSWTLTRIFSNSG